MVSTIGRQLPRIWRLALNGTTWTFIHPPVSIWRRRHDGNGAADGVDFGAGIGAREQRGRGATALFDGEHRGRSRWQQQAVIIDWRRLGIQPTQWGS